MAALEGGIAGVAAASGQSAIFMTLMTLVHAGENIVVSSSLYGGVYNMFKVRFPTFGVTTKFVDGGRPEDIAAAIDDKTRVVYVESISNPSFDVPDLAAIAKVAHDRGLPLVVSAPPLPLCHTSGTSRATSPTAARLRYSRKGKKEGSADWRAWLLG